MAQAGRQPQPGLLAQFDHNPIFHRADADGQRSLTARHGASACSNLDCHIIVVSEQLCIQIPAVELCHEGMGNVVRFDVAVKDSPIHVFDYNPFYSDDDRSSHCISMNIYAMKRLWFKTFVGTLTVVSLGAGIFLTSAQVVVRAQQASTPTGVFVTVTYTDPINVRGGPSTVNYPIIGQLAPGEVVPALGVSPQREWVQITYPPTGGTGWVYAAFVSVSGGELRIVEPPPTPTPPVTSTIDPTLAAAFNVQPTETRLPTFTPPPPLEVPEFDDTSRGSPSRAVFGAFIIGLGLTGAIGLLVSYVLRR